MEDSENKTKAFWEMQPRTDPIFAGIGLGTSLISANYFDHPVGRFLTILGGALIGIHLPGTCLAMYRGLRKIKRLDSFPLFRKIDELNRRERAEKSFNNFYWDDDDSFHGPSFERGYRNTCRGYRLGDYRYQPKKIKKHLEHFLENKRTTVSGIQLDEDLIIGLSLLYAEREGGIPNIRHESGQTVYDGILNDLIPRIAVSIYLRNQKLERPISIEEYDKKLTAVYKQLTTHDGKGHYTGPFRYGENQDFLKNQNT